MRVLSYESIVTRAGACGQAYAVARQIFADYGKGEPCKAGETAARSGCVPGAEAGFGGGLEVDTEKIDEVQNVMGGVLDAVGKKGFSTAERRGAQRGLEQLGMDRKLAQRWLDTVAGKPEVAEKVRRMVRNYALGIRDSVKTNFRNMIALQERQGIPRAIAVPTAVAGSILAGSPVSITTAFTGAGIIGAWGATPGLGIVEGALVVALPILGKKTIQAAGRVARAVFRLDPLGLFLSQQLVAAAALPTVSWQYQADDEQPKPVDVLAIAKDVQQRADPSWDEDRKLAYLRTVVFVALGGIRENIGRMAARIVNAADAGDIQDILAKN